MIGRLRILFKRFRDSRTGRWVTKAFAKANPDTTQSETVEKGE